MRFYAIGVPISKSVSEWQYNEENFAVKNANFVTLNGCHGNVP